MIKASEQRVRREHKVGSKDRKNDKASIDTRAERRKGLGQKGQIVYRYKGIRTGAIQRTRGK